MDLIFAEASPSGRGGVSVIRLSGPGARNAAESLAGALPLARHAYLRTLRDGGEIIDQALVLWFQEGASFTGEETAEIQCHGASVVVRRIAHALMARSARPAEAGEFTRRAFLNGRMDLAEVEGLGDLLAAETDLQRRQAMRVLSGEVRERVDRWRRALIRMGALIEASIDFADEEVPDDVPEEVFELAQALAREISRELDGFQAAERVRNGFEVAIVGRPNAGKSSLINRLARREVAIVSEVPGTTRDVLELRLDLQGLAVTVLDTAGLRETGDQVERLGVSRAAERAAAADLRIHLSPENQAVSDLWTPGDLLVQSKADVVDLRGELAVSSATGEGIERLLGSLYERLQDRIAGAGMVTHERQFHELSWAKQEIERLVPGQGAEITAEHVRGAAASLDRVVGRIAADDYLDVVFSSFCIGK